MEQIIVDITQLKSNILKKNIILFIHFIQTVNNFNLWCHLQKIPQWSCSSYYTYTTYTLFLWSNDWKNLAVPTANMISDHSVSSSVIKIGFSQCLIIFFKTMSQETKIISINLFWVLFIILPNFWCVGMIRSKLIFAFNIVTS